MPHDPQHRAMRTMPPQIARAPRTIATLQIVISPTTRLPIRYAESALDDFADETHGRSVSGETVVATLEFEIGVADPAQQQSDECKPLRPMRLRRVANFDDTSVEMHG